MLRVGSHSVCKHCFNTLLLIRYQQQRGAKWTSTAVRQSFLDFFCHNDHKYVPSSSVIPKKNEGTYFTNAGMNQFKPIFLDQLDTRHPMAGYQRVVNSQKCVRVGGKHNDLDDVGKDLYHHTFFEMLGSWSFGDYFKEEACRMALDLLTNVYGIPVTRLYFTYFGGDVNLGLKPDLETKAIWQSLKVPSDRILPFGMRDNFWDMGDSGPCGPCTEIHYDHLGTGNNGHLVNRGSKDVVEIWNLVFMQYNRMSDGGLEPLHKLHVDTGMGLERMLAVMNQSSSTYNTDLFMPLFQAIQKVSNARTYGGRIDDEVDIAYRIVADHIRMASVCIADGLLPGSKNQGHKLQSVIFRCLYQSKRVLCMPDGTVPQLVDVVAQTLVEIFPEIENNRKKIKDVLLESEAHYTRAVEYGRKAFNRYMKKNPNQTHLTAHDLLNITDGVYSDGNSVPVEMLSDLGDMYHVTSDVPGLMILLEQRHDHVNQGTTKDKVSVSPETIKQIREARIQPTDDSLKYQYKKVPEGTYSFGHGSPASVLGIVMDDNLFSEVQREDECCLVLDRTLFYSEGGGQAADIGYIVSKDGKFKVRDVQTCNNYVLHIGEMVSGRLSVGEAVTLSINEEHRLGCMCNHTATHILNGWLRTLYSDVRQEGSRIYPHKFSFDFTTTSNIKVEDLIELQNRVQETIDQKLNVNRALLPFEEAMKIPNIVHMVQEEYPSDVFTVSIGTDGNQFSTELCGGTHVKNTEDIQCFCIISASLQSQSSKSITCLTGAAAKQAIEKGQKLEQDIDELENNVKSKTGLESWMSRSKQINKVLGEETLPKNIHDNIKHRIDLLGDPMKMILNTVKKEQLKQEILENLKHCTSDLCRVETETQLTHQTIKQVLIEVKATKPVAVVSSNGTTPIVLCAHQDSDIVSKINQLVQKSDKMIKVKTRQKQGYTLLTISFKQDDQTVCDELQSVLCLK